MNPRLQRVQHMLDLRRFDLAMSELRQILLDDPDDALARALLAHCLLGTKDLDGALTEARLAVGAAPAQPYLHFVLALVHAGREELREAEGAAREAIRLDPEDADYHGFLANLLAARRRWEEALAEAEAGLGVDAQNKGCLNVRAQALVYLGRADEASGTLDEALRRDPDDARTHANMGWTRLHEGRHQDALEHFREALRLRPGMEWARAGIIEAMKARNVVYRALLRYILWMDRLGAGRQWTLIIVAYVLYRVVLGIKRANPALSPWLTPLILLYVAFVYVTWISTPLFNLILRLDRFGRNALSRDQIVASNWFGSLLFTGLALVGAWVATAHELFLLGGIAAIVLTVPVSATFGASGRNRLILALLTSGLAAVAIGFFVALFTGSAELADQLMLAFLIGLVAFMLTANVLATRSR